MMADVVKLLPINKNKCCLVERKTKNVLFVGPSRRALELSYALNTGAGFNGWTPGFIAIGNVAEQSTKLAKIA
jgi:hypothetical protein